LGIFSFLFGKRSRHPPHESGWVVSSNGNPTREYLGQRITVFDADHGFKFCIADPVDGDDPYYSERYDSLEAAKYEAMAYMDGGPSTHQTTKAKREDQSLAVSRDIVSDKRRMLAEISSSLSQENVDLKSLRATERKLVTGVKGLQAARTVIFVSGRDIIEIESVDDLIAVFSRQLTALEVRIAEVKTTPRKRTAK
jgi:conjugal transfer/entry exclusion protein